MTAIQEIRRMKRIVAASFLVIAICGTAGAQVKNLRAGAYAQDITPAKLPISVNGGMAEFLKTSARHCWCSTSTT